MIESNFERPLFSVFVLYASGWRPAGRVSVFGSGSNTHGFIAEPDGEDGRANALHTYHRSAGKAARALAEGRP